MQINFINYYFVLNRNTGLACSNYWLDLIGDDDLSYAMSTNNQLLKCQPRCERQSETAVFTSAAFETCWSDDQDISYYIVLSGLCEKNSLDAVAIFAANML